MKTLSALVRSKTSLEQTYRRTYGNVNIQQRKQIRRIKKLNIYNKELSGQSNQNSWFTPKRLKAMGNHLESVKNNHIGTNPVPVETQQQLLKVMSKLSQYQYFHFRNREKQQIQHSEFLNSSDLKQFISKLPAKLRKDLEAAENQQQPTPQIAQPLLKYSQQLQVFLPQDERHRYNVMQKILHAPAAKVEQQDTFV